MLITVFFSVFSGLAVGTNVLISNNYGAKKYHNVIKSTHTSIAVAVLGGILLGILGICCTDTFLHILNVPESLFAKARNYVILFFIGTPFVMIYNFGSAILRAVGDSKRPLIFVAGAGVFNVLLNLLFVIVFKMNVVGVALATLLSNILSAYLVFRTLLRSHNCIGIKIPLIRINLAMFRSILRIGVPAGLQNAMFGISNLTILSSINSFGENTIAGNTAASSLESICWIASNAFHQAVVTFVAQNYGAGKPKRILQSILYCLLLGTLISGILAYTGLYFGKPLLSCFNSTPEVIEQGMIRLKIILSLYFFVAIMDVLAGAVRGLGYSLLTAVISVIGVCVFRVFWVIYIFPKDHTLENLMISYPVSWAVTA